jgi:hypothetical protein
MFTLFLRELPVYVALSGVRSTRSAAERALVCHARGCAELEQATSWCGKKNRLLFALAQREVSGDEAS